MIVGVKDNATRCIYRELAEEYQRERRDVLTIVYPNISFNKCDQCTSVCQDYEQVPPNSEFDDILFSIERIIAGVGMNLEFPGNPQAARALRFSRRTPNGHPTSSGRSFNLSHRVSLRLEELSGNPRVDREQVATMIRTQEEHSTDYDSTPQQVDDELIHID